MKRVNDITNVELDNTMNEQEKIITHSWRETQFKKKEYSKNIPMYQMIVVTFVKSVEDTCKLSQTFNGVFITHLSLLSIIFHKKM